MKGVGREESRMKSFSEVAVQSELMRLFQTVEKYKDTSDTKVSEALSAMMDVQGVTTITLRFGQDRKRETLRAQKCHY